MTLVIVTVSIATGCYMLWSVIDYANVSREYKREMDKMARRVTA
jgi:hypothetical protein